MMIGEVIWKECEHYLECLREYGTFTCLGCVFYQREGLPSKRDLKRVVVAGPK